MELPFDKLVLTSFGYQKFVSRPVPQDRLTHIGLTILAERDTRFRLEIAEVRAVARMRQPDVEDSPEQQAKVVAREERVKLSIARRKRAEREAAIAAAGGEQEEEEEEEEEKEEEEEEQAAEEQEQEEQEKEKKQKKTEGEEERGSGKHREERRGTERSGRA